MSSRDLAAHQSCHLVPACIAHPIIGKLVGPFRLATLKAVLGRMMAQSTRAQTSHAMPRGCGNPPGAGGLVAIPRQRAAP